MRFSIASVAVLAGVVAALPQDVQPITQIDDGQLQAPPATSAASEASEGTAVPTEAVSSAVESVSSVLQSVISSVQSERKSTHIPAWSQSELTNA
jgi:hypothetical protein